MVVKLCQAGLSTSPAGVFSFYKSALEMLNASAVDYERRDSIVPLWLAIVTPLHEHVNQVCLSVSAVVPSIIFVDIYDKNTSPKSFAF